MKKVCYFVKLQNKKLVHIRRWYVDELKMLSENGYDVRLCTKFGEVFRKRDLYVSWWAQTSLFSVLAARIYKKKSFVIPGGIEISKAIPDAGYNKKNKLKRFLIKLTLKMCDVIIAVSEYNKQEILEIMGAKYAEKIEVLYHCVSDGYFKYEIVRCFEKKYYLLITGLCKGNIERKCVYQVIDAISAVSKKIPKIKLVIAGVIEDKSEYEKLVQYIGLHNLGENVEVVTNVTEEEKIQLLNNAYYYLQPSFHEQFGLAIAEAMACGCPVISTNITAIPEVVGESGYLIEKNTKEEIILALERTYFDEEGRYTNAVCAQKRASELFRYEIKKNKFYDILENCDSQSRRKI